MKRIYLSEGKSLEDKRLLRALEIELIERGALVTRSSEDDFDVAVTVGREQYDEGVMVFFLCYEREDAPDGTVPITRPFSIEKFADSLTRSFLGGGSSSRADEGIVFDNGSLRYGQNEIPLSSNEAKLFSILYENRGKPVSKEAIKESLWGVGDSNVVEVYISYLRKKLDIKFGKKLIVTVRNKGYMLI